MPKFVTVVPIEKEDKSYVGFEVSMRNASFFTRLEAVFDILFNKEYCFALDKDDATTLVDDIHKYTHIGRYPWKGDSYAKKD